MSSEIFCYQAQKGKKRKVSHFSTPHNFRTQYKNKEKYSIAICKGSGISVESLICMPKLCMMKIVA